MDIDWEIGTFKEEVKRFGHIVKKLRDREQVTIYDGQGKTFYRFRLNPTDKNVFWIMEASLDRKNWVIQFPYYRLRNVLKKVYDNKVENKLND